MPLCLCSLVTGENDMNDDDPYMKAWSTCLQFWHVVYNYWQHFLVEIKIRNQDKPQVIKSSIAVAAYSFHSYPGSRGWIVKSTWAALGQEGFGGTWETFRSETTFAMHHKATSNCRSRTVPIVQAKFPRSVRQMLIEKLVHFWRRATHALCGMHTHASSVQSYKIDNRPLQRLAWDCLGQLVLHDFDGSCQGISGSSSMRSLNNMLGALR